MFKKSLLSIVFALVALLAVTSPVSAGAQPVQAGTTITICTFIGPICEAFGITDPSGAISAQNAFNFVRSRANTLLSVLFVGIILISVYIIIRAGIKYIQSQGEEKEIAEAQKAIKTVFIGIGVLFVGIAGLVLVLAFFGGLGLLNSDTTVQNVVCPETDPACISDE